MHEQIFKNRGWWQRLDDERECFAALLMHFNLDASNENVGEVWLAAWIASWPFVELTWVPSNHRSSIEAKARSLLSAMQEAGLELTAQFAIVGDIASACDPAEPVPKGEFFAKSGRPGTRAWNDQGLLALYEEYCRIADTPKAAIAIGRGEGRSEDERAPPALRFATEALRVYRPDTKIRAVSDAMSAAIKEGSLLPTSMSRTNRGS